MSKEDIFINEDEMGLALKICIDTLIDIVEGSTNDGIKVRAKATIEEVHKILNKDN